MNRYTSNPCPKRLCKIRHFYCLVIVNQAFCPFYDLYAGIVHTVPVTLYMRKTFFFLKGIF